MAIKTICPRSNRLQLLHKLRLDAVFRLFELRHRHAIFQYRIDLLDDFLLQNIDRNTIDGHRIDQKHRRRPRHLRTRNARSQLLLIDQPIHEPRILPLAQYR